MKPYISFLNKTCVIVIVIETVIQNSVSDCAIVEHPVCRTNAFTTWKRNCSRYNYCTLKRKPKLNISTFKSALMEKVCSITFPCVDMCDYRGVS